MQLEMSSPAGLAPHIREPPQQQNDPELQTPAQQSNLTMLPRKRITLSPLTKLLPLKKSKTMRHNTTLHFGIGLTQSGKELSRTRSENNGTHHTAPCTTPPSPKHPGCNYPTHHQAINTQKQTVQQEDPQHHNTQHTDTARQSANVTQS